VIWEEYLLLVILTVAVILDLRNLLPISKYRRIALERLDKFFPSWYNGLVRRKPIYAKGVFYE